MRWLPLAVVLVAHGADAKPRQVFDGGDYPPPCRPSASWRTLAACQFKGSKIVLLQDLPAAKLVAIDLGPGPAGRQRLELYLLDRGAWKRSTFYSELNATTELLGFARVSDGTYRLDIGSASATWVTLDETSAHPALVKRQYTHVCVATERCRVVMTSCDVLVHGKAVATFRGDAQWDGRKLTIRGDARNTNRYCVKPPNLVEVDS